MWQDYCFSIAAFMVGYSVIPQIIKVYKSKDAELISWQMILISLFALFIRATAFISLSMYLTFCINIFQFMCWSTLILQKLYYDSNSNHNYKYDNTI